MSMSKTQEAHHEDGTRNGSSQGQERRGRSIQMLPAKYLMEKWLFREGQRSLKQTAARSPFAFNPTEFKPEKSVKRWSWPAAPISSGWRTRSRPCTLEKAKKNAYWT